MTLTRRSTLPTVVATVARVLERAGIQAVLTGGACATIHTDGAYQSQDLDFIVRGGVTRRLVDDAMGTIDFGREGDRYLHPETAFFVEFPRGPLAIGNDLDIEPVRLRVGRGSVLALSPTDACRDRLAAFYHWSDRQSFEVAIQIALCRRVDLSAIRRWSRLEDADARFEEFQGELAQRKRRVASRRR